MSGYFKRDGLGKNISRIIKKYKKSTRPAQLLRPYFEFRLPLDYYPVLSYEPAKIAYPICQQGHLIPQLSRSFDSTIRHFLHLFSVINKIPRCIAEFRFGFRSTIWIRIAIY